MNREGRLPVSLMYEAMDQMQQGVLVIKVTEVQSKIVFVNKAYTRVTGYSKDELLDKPTTYLRKHIAHDKVVAQINHAVNDGQDTEVITPSYSRDGDKYWMRITIHPVVDIGHSDRFFILVHDDVSEEFNNRKSYVRRHFVLEERNRELEEQVIHDPLTSLHNRRFFNSEFDRLCGYHRRHNLAVSIAFIDIDFFKDYNDCYGHLEGDKAIMAVADVIQRRFCRLEDLCVRYGGEEFVIMSTADICEESIVEHFDALRREIEMLGIAHSKSGCSKVLTVSMGLFTGLLGEDVHNSDILRSADRALYEAKTAGRNQVVSIAAEGAILQSPKSSNFAKVDSTRTKTLYSV